MSFDISKFRGTTVALITPFTSQGEVDDEKLRSLVDWHVEQGTDVILACGTTGESATLSHEEHQRVIDIVIEQAAGRVPVMAGAGSNATDEAISLTEHASRAGADAILSVGPYYNKPTQQGYYEHFKSHEGTRVHQPPSERRVGDRDYPAQSGLRGALHPMEGPGAGLRSYSRVAPRHR